MQGWQQSLHVLGGQQSLHVQGCGQQSLHVQGWQQSLHVQGCGQQSLHVQGWQQCPLAQYWQHPTPVRDEPHQPARAQHQRSSWTAEVTVPSWP